ncbi:MAG: MaoC family dehydratase [Desulfobacterales bacterium]
MSTMRRRVTRGLAVGDAFSVTRTFSAQEVAQFADLTRDFNPVHFDQRFARSKNIPAVICHGLLVAGMITQIGGQIGWLASGMGFKFKKPVFIGDTITCTFTIGQIDERSRAAGNAVYTNQQGEVVLEADLKGILPGPAERRIMQAMVAEGDPTNGRRGLD